MASSPFLLDGEIGSLADDDEAFPGLDVHFYCAHGLRAARRDWERDAEFEIALRGYLLAE